MSKKIPHQINKSANPTLMIAIIGVIGTIVTAFFTSPWVKELIALPTLIPTATVPQPTSTSTITLTLTPTATLTSTPTNTPLPLPLVEVFPQSVDGQEFVFINEGALLTPQFVADQNCTHSGIYGLRFTYDMKENVSGGWGVHWVNPPVTTHFYASDFHNLTFSVRGALGGETFQVSMKDTNNHEFWIESRSVLVVTSNWIMVSIPLNKFQGVNTSSVENLAFGFNHTHGLGSICIDDIAFVP